MMWINKPTLTNAYNRYTRRLFWFTLSFSYFWCLILPAVANYMPDKLVSWVDYWSAFSHAAEILPYDLFYRRRLPTKIFHDVVVLGKRYTGPEAKHESIVHATSSSQQLLTDAINVANRLKGIPRDNLRDMKQAIYADFLEICDKGLKNMSRL